MKIHLEQITTNHKFHGKKQLGFVDSEFVKTCDELVIGRSARFSSRESSVIKSEEKPMEISRDARGILESSYQDTDFF